MWLRFRVDSSLRVDEGLVRFRGRPGKGLRVGLHRGVCRGESAKAVGRREDPLAFPRRLVETVAIQGLCWLGTVCRFDILAVVRGKALLGVGGILVVVLHRGLAVEAGRPSGAISVSRPRRVESGLADGRDGVGGGGGDVFEEGCPAHAIRPLGLRVGVVHAFPLRRHGLLLCWCFHVAHSPVLTPIVREEPRHELLDAVLAADLETAVKGDPCSLVFAVASLDLFVLARLDFLFEHLCAPSLVDTSHLEDLRGIEPAVGLSAHDGDPIDLHLVDIDARVRRLDKTVSIDTQKKGEEKDAPSRWA